MTPATTFKRTPSSSWIRAKKRMCRRCKAHYCHRAIKTSWYCTKRVTASTSSGLTRKVRVRSWTTTPVLITSKLTQLLATSATKLIRRERMKTKTKRLRVALARSGNTLASQSSPWKSISRSRRKVKITYWHPRTKRNSRWSTRSPSANFTASARIKKFPSTSGMSGSAINLRESYRSKEQSQLRGTTVKDWSKEIGQKTIFSKRKVGRH